LKFLNSECKRRRLEATKAGKKFLPYPEAQRRLRNAMATTAATGSMPEIMRAVFDVAAKP
jgi:hypothetical protein